MKKSKLRLLIVTIFFGLGIISIAARTFYLAFHSSRTKKRDTIVRGSILDRHGFTLAMTEEASTIAVAPQEVYDYEQTAEILSGFLGMTARDILKRIYERKNRRYFYLKRRVDNLKADQLMDLNLPGIYREREYRRRYPGGTLASNLIGFVGPEQSKALAGIERNWNSVLTNASSPRQHIGHSLQLTIDSLIQHHLEQELGQAFERSGSKRAVGIVMDINTGAILAMASFPNFDPNRYHESTPFQRGNWVIRLNYEPGSTVKIFMAAILLAEKAVLAHEKFLCDGQIHFYDSTVRCRSRGKVIRHGRLTLSEIIEKSCNVGIIKAVQRVPPKRIFYYMKKLGFGQKTNIFPSGSGETKGYFPDIQYWVPSTSYYIPIGQGFSITPIQLLRAGTALVNQGKLLRPYTAWRIHSSENNQILHEQKAVWKKSPFDESIHREVRKMMEKTVRYGTGKAASSAGINVLGKTGTGEKSSAQGYLDKYIVSFLGFFPARKPLYSALILFDEPENEHSGGSLAAPVFGRVVRAILPFLESKERPTELAKLPPLPVHSWKVQKDVLYDLRSLTAGDAVQIIRGFYGLKVELKGSGYVYRQIPPPGTPIRKIKKVTLYLSGLQ